MTCIVTSGNHSALLHKIQFSTELSASPSKSLNSGKPFWIHVSISRNYFHYVSLRINIPVFVLQID